MSRDPAVYVAAQLDALCHAREAVDRSILDAKSPRLSRTIAYLRREADAATRYADALERKRGKR